MTGGHHSTSQHGPLRLKRPQDIWPLASGLVALIVATPILVVAASLARPRLDIWAHLWSTQLAGLIGNTLALLLGVGVCVSILGVSLAWLITMYRFPCQRLFTWILILPLAMPAYVIGFVFLAVFDYVGPVQTWLRSHFGNDVWFPDMASYGGVITVMTLVLYPYVYMLARAAFLEQAGNTREAARALGVSRFAVFWRVVLPLARPSIVAGLGLALMEALADFGTVSLFNYSTFTVAIYRVWFGLFDRAAATQLASLLLFFTLALYALERGFRGRARFYESRNNGRTLRPTRLRGWRAWLATLSVASVVWISFGLPVTQLIIWALSHAGRMDYDSHYPAFAANTLTLATITSLLAITAAVVVAYGLRLSRSRAVALFGRIANMGYALPGSVIAVGVLAPLAFIDHVLGDVLLSFFGISSGLLLTGSMGALVFAYLVRFLAVSCQTVEASLVKISPSMDMAARSLGATPGRVLGRIHIPLIRGGLYSAAILVFVDVMKEMPATLLLRPFGYDTLAVRVWQLTSESFWEAAALPALTIVAAGILPILILVKSSIRPQTMP